MKNIFKKSEKGFTLIELLVVIAIIAILSTIVLASLGQARGRARDARAQSELSSMRAQAELFYNQNGLSYGSTSCGTGANDLLGTSPSSLAKLYASVSDYVGSGNYDCSSTSSAWAVAAKLPASGKVFCVDSNGTAREVTTSGATATSAVSGQSCQI